MAQGIDFFNEAIGRGRSVKAYQPNDIRVIER
jgi:hypothetical protein